MCDADLSMDEPTATDGIPHHPYDLDIDPAGFETVFFW
jgi:hypothetical protein